MAIFSLTTTWSSYPIVVCCTKATHDDVLVDTHLRCGATTLLNSIFAALLAVYLTQTHGTRESWDPMLRCSIDMVTFFMSTVPDVDEDKETKTKLFCLHQTQAAAFWIVSVCAP